MAPAVPDSLMTGIICVKVVLFAFETNNNILKTVFRAIKVSVKRTAIMTLVDRFGEWWETLNEEEQDAVAFSVGRGT